MPRFPEDLSYTVDHEWARFGNARRVRVGVTEWALDRLGAVTDVTLPELGEELTVGDACAELGSDTASWDVLAPLPGVVVQVNETLLDNPGIVTNDPYGDGWIIELELDDEADDDELLDSDAYAEALED